MAKSFIFAFSLFLLGTLLLANPVGAAAVSPGEIDALAALERQKISSDDGATDDQFGWSVAVEGDIALVGAPNTRIGTNEGQGSVYVFTKMHGPWVQTQKLTADDGKTADAFGLSVAIAGTTAIVGSPNNETFRGAAYVFQLAAGTWVQSQKLVASDGTDFNQFGWSVALQNQAALIGATSATVGSNGSQGAVYAFTETGTFWSETQKFSSADGVTGDGFGWSIGLDGKNAVVGAGLASGPGGEFQGVAYTFRHRNGVWVETQKLTADNGAAFDFFGLAVALEGRNVLVGAQGAATDGNPFSNQGAVYRFFHSGGVWSQTQIISASDGKASDGFGTSVAVRRGVVVIGAAGATVDGIDFAGAAYIFHGSSGSLVETDKLTPSDPVENGNFGWSAALSRNAVFIGSYNATSDEHVRQGAVYIDAGH